TTSPTPTVGGWFCFCRLVFTVTRISERTDRRLEVSGQVVGRVAGTVIYKIRATIISGGVVIAITVTGARAIACIDKIWAALRRAAGVNTIIRSTGVGRSRIPTAYISPTFAASLRHTRSLFSNRQGYDLLSLQTVLNVLAYSQYYLISHA
ncbi:MAG TPA: hypothetical protein VLF67_02130, partial [Candidatus Saccharimonas sp.]|nr:hypothetical protein [Candidatus Saccharimonas sp.]